MKMQNWKNNFCYDSTDLKQKIVEKEKIEEMIDPADQESSYERFLKGKNMIEGVNEIEQDIDGGIELLKKINYWKLFRCFDLLLQVTCKREYNSKKHSDVLLLYGKVLLREKQFTEAKKMIKKSVKKENSEAMFEYGKLLYCGKETQGNEVFSPFSWKRIWEK